MLVTSGEIDPIARCVASVSQGAETGHSSLLKSLDNDISRERNTPEIRQ